MTSFAAHLDVFTALCAHRTFTAAARAVALSQPAFSKRIAQLERAVGARLFVRGRTGARLTHEGERLRRYADEICALERDFHGTERAEVHIAAISTAFRSCLLPKLAAWMRAHPEVYVSASVATVPSIVPRVLSAEVDIGVTLEAAPHPALEIVAAWDEENVLVRSLRHPPPAGVYLDVNEADTTSLHFVAQARRLPPACVLKRRVFFGDIYALLDAAAHGLGYLVAPVHLVAADTRLTVVPGLSRFVEPVQLVRLRPLSTLRRTPADTLFGLMPSWGPKRR